MKFTKKPVTIEARQFPDPEGASVELDEANEIAGWCGGEATIDAVDGPCILIETLEGTMKARVGDWVIKGVNGEFYPCKPDIFAKTYEPADEQPSPAQMDYGDAIRALKRGERVARRGWNGKGMWISLSGPGPRAVSHENLWSENNAAEARRQGGQVIVLPCITMRTAQGDILMGWLASQTDQLAEDWEILRED